MKLKKERATIQATVIRNSLKKTFGSVSELYEEVNPTYPIELIEDIIATAALPKNGRVLDIGCGTGNATLPFAERGYQVTGVDISENMIALARGKTKAYPATNYVVSPFESAKLPDHSFDLAIAGRSFHWIDPAARFEKVHSILKKGGTLAMFWNRPDYHASPLLERIHDLCKKYCPFFDDADEVALRGRWRKRCLENEDLFLRTSEKVYMQNEKFTREKFVKFLESAPWVISLEPKTKETFLTEMKKMLAQHQERFDVPFAAVLLLLKSK